MKVHEHDNACEREILAAMIVHPTVLGRIASQWSKDPFFSTPANTIGDLCVKFHRKHQTCPNRNGVESLVRSWGASCLVSGLVDQVEEFLAHIPDDLSAEDINSGHAIELASNHFDDVKLLRLSDSIRADVEAKQREKAFEKVTTLRRTQLSGKSGIDLFNDEEAIRSTFAKEVHEPLIDLPGDAGKFFGDSLSRGKFLSILAPEKTGKSMVMLDLATRAVAQRRRVAYFQVGDMTEAEVKLRFACRVSKRPIRKGVIKWPTSLKTDSKQPCAEVEFDEKKFDTDLDQETASAAYERFRKDKVRSNRSFFKLFTYPNYTIDVFGVDSEVETLTQNGWPPDCVFIDYADVLSPPSGYKDFREQTHVTWMRLRSLSQARHCLLVTATQSDAAGYEARTLTRKNFSEDKRKLSHVSGVFGLNVTSREKERQLMRLNWIVLRDQEYSWRKCVTIAGCLSLANPCVLSSF